MLIHSAIPDLRAALKARAQEFSIDKAVDQYEALLFPQLRDRGSV